MKTIVLPNSTIALLNGFAAEQRGRTINWLRSQLGLSRSDAEDIFQDSFLILYENLANGTLAKLPRSLSAYLNETCRRKALEILRDNEKKNGKVVFKIVDISTDEGEKIAKKYRVTWSSLFVNGWKAGKEKRNDMTQFAFKNARKNSDEFKRGVSGKIKELMK